MKKEQDCENDKRNMSVVMCDKMKNTMKNLQ